MISSSDISNNGSYGNDGTWYATFSWIYVRIEERVYFFTNGYIINSCTYDITRI